MATSAKTSKAKKTETVKKELATKKDGKKSATKLREPVSPPREKRPYPSKDERIVRVNEAIERVKASIAAYEERLKKLEEKKQRIEAPSRKDKGISVRQLISIAKSNGMSTAEIAEKLGLAAQADEILASKATEV